MKILLANPRGFCAGVDRAIDIVERAIELFGAPDLRAARSRAQRHVVERLRAARRAFRRRAATRCRPAPRVIFSAHGVSSAVENEARARGLTRVRCDLSARDQGAHGSRALRARRPRRGADRPRRAIRRSRAPWAGSSRDFGGHIHLVENVEEAREARGARPATSLAFVTQTTLSVDDTAAIVEALRERFPKLQAPRLRRHLLRHAEPPGRGEEAVASMRRAGRRRLGARAPTRTGCASSRERAGVASAISIDGPLDLQRGVVRRQARRGRHGRRIGARSCWCSRSSQRLREWGGEPPDEVVGREEHVVFSLPRALRVVDSDCRLTPASLRRVGAATRAALPPIIERESGAIAIVLLR